MRTIILDDSSRKSERVFLLYLYLTEGESLEGVVSFSTSIFLCVLVRGLFILDLFFAMWRKCYLFET